MKFLLVLLAVSAFADTAQTVIVFGDSITAGGALPANERDAVWVRAVERESKGRLRMVNEGKGGRPTDSVKEFEAMLARQPQAAVLVIALGTNDSRDITAACVPKAVANVRAMIARARQQYGAKLRDIGDAFAALAKETGCEFTSLFGTVPEASMTKDGVHPDAAGNAAIARAMLAKLAPQSVRCWQARRVC